MKSPDRIVLQLHFPYATGRRSTTGLLEQMPRSKDRRASARMARITTRPLRSTIKLPSRAATMPGRLDPLVRPRHFFVP